MNSKVLIVCGVVFALGLAGFLWYQNEAPAGMVRDDAPVPATTDKVDTNAPTVPTKESLLVGTWQSSADTKFSREFKNDGTVIDRYRGNDDATVSGHWSVGNKDTLPAKLTVPMGATVLSVVFPEEGMFFIIDSVTLAELDLHYAGASDILHFVRLP